MPLQAADDLGLRETLASPPSNVGACLGAITHAHDYRDVESLIGRPVAPTMETVSSSIARGGWNRGDTAESGEGSLGTESVRVVTDGDQESCRRVAPESEGAKGRRRILGQEAVELVIEFANLGLEIPNPPGNRPEGQLGCLKWVVDALEIGPKREARGEELATGTKRTQLLAKDDRRSDHQGSQGVESRCPGLFGTDPSHPQSPHGLDRTIAAFGGNRRCPSENRSSGCFGIERV